MYWEITPHLNHDFDSVVVETDTEALAYAQAVVEYLWDQAEPDVEYTLKIKKCSGEMPALDEVRKMTTFFRCAECGDYVKANEFGECSYCGGDVEIIDGEA